MSLPKETFFNFSNTHKDQIEVPSSNHLMPLSMSLPCVFKAALFFFFFCFFFTFLPSKSVGLIWSMSSAGEKETINLEKGERESYVVDQKKMVIGSRPPRCENKCKSCRPCMAAVVVPVHRKKWFKAFFASSRVEDDSYYLLSWKCRCGNKIYQP